MKKIIALILAIVTIMAVMPSVVSAASISLVIDGTTIKTNTEPTASGKTVLVPIKEVAETLGAQLSWNDKTKQAMFQTAAYRLVFTLDSKTLVVNGKTKTLDATVKSADNSVMVPLQAFESIGAKTNFANNKAEITYFTNLTGSLKIDGSTTLQPIAQAAADKLVEANKGLSITVAGGGSGTGIKDATAGTVNIGMSSRDLTADELKELKAYAVANDGIAIIVHPDNPVKNLTKEQAKKIFLGEITNWKDVGGNNASIIVYTRETGSGTRATLEEMILDKKSVVERATPFTSSALIKQAVAKEKNSIGFDSIGFVDKTVKAVSLDDKAADSKTVLEKSYGMGRQLFCCTKGNATGLAAIFIDYLRSSAVQNEIVEKEGYIKLK